MSKDTPAEEVNNADVLEAAKLFAKKKFVFTDELKDYNEEMYVSFIAGAKWQSSTPDAGKEQDEPLDPEFDKWLENNRWFNYSPVTKLWSYTFEHGTAISNREYRKNYMKTTSELYTLYKKNK